MQDIMQVADIFSSSLIMKQTMSKPAWKHSYMHIHEHTAIPSFL